MTEYIIIVALIAISAIGVVTRFGDNIKALFGAAIGALNGQDNVTPNTKASSSAFEKKTIKTFAQNNGG